MALAIAVANLLWTNSAAYGETSLTRHKPAMERGVRHRLDAFVRLAPAVAKIHGANAVTRASLTLSLLISANSRETRFFGAVRPTFSSFTLEGVANQRVWEEAVCHQPRGLPKITVVSISGSFGEGEHRMAVDARTRQLGLRLPADEITVGTLPAGQDAGGASHGLHLKTSSSRIIVDLKLHSLDCELGRLVPKMSKATDGSPNPP